VRIDLSADVGEGLDAADVAILPWLTSANIACGAHAGDAATMARTVALAIEHDVTIGAHPGYPDREGFGRRDMELSATELAATLVEQLTALDAVADAADARLRHVKVHGALYGRAATDRELADVVAGTIRDVLPGVALVGPPLSALIEAGRAAGLAVVAEGFADRAYEPDGSLRRRTLPGAVLEDPAAVAAQAVSIARDGRAELEGGGWVAVEAETICLHGDSPGAVENVQEVRSALDAAGVIVASTAGGS
jgi:UPF0271 protein